MKNLNKNCAHPSRNYAMMAALFVSMLAGGNFAFAQSNEASPEGVSLLNLGGDMGGHTPRGFQGQGNGVFVGDNLNPNFPNGEGVQAFISFDITTLLGTGVNQARLTSDYLHISGTPFIDLGRIRLEQIHFDRFSSALWNSEVDIDSGCILAVSVDQTSVSCDLTDAVKSAVNESLDFLQFRLRFEEVSDSDRQQDLALFFKQNSNVNEGGVFEVLVN